MQKCYQKIKTEIYYNGCISSLVKSGKESSLEEESPPNTPLSHHILILSAHHWIQAHAVSRRIQGIL